jgi:hypothetical protein
VDSATDPLLEGVHGALDLTDVAVRENNVKVNGTNGIPETFKLIVGMEFTEDEATVTIKAKNGVQGL